MKAITLWQPWASLVIAGFKPVETRCWETKYRGPLAIHAALTKPSFLGMSVNTEAFQRFYALTGLPPIADLPRGCILGTCALKDIKPTSEVREILSEMIVTFGKFEDGNYAWFLDNITIFTPPIQASGNRRLWNWDARVTGSHDVKDLHGKVNQGRAASAR